MLKLQSYGIDLPLLAGIAVAFIIELVIGNWVVGGLQRIQFGRLLRADDPNTTVGEIKAKQAEIASELDLTFARLIGSTERLIYILAVVAQQWSLISAWIVLKAFFGWLAKSGKRHSERMPLYHLYLFGNALSLILGIMLGYLALVLSKVIWSFTVVV